MKKVYSRKCPKSRRQLNVNQKSLKNSESTKDIWKNALKDRGLSLFSSSSDDDDVSSKTDAILYNYQIYHICNKNSDEKPKSASYYKALISLYSLNSSESDDEYSYNKNKYNYKYKNKNKIMPKSKPYHNPITESPSSFNKEPDLLLLSDASIHPNTESQYQENKEIYQCDGLISDSLFENKLTAYQQTLKKKKEETRNIIEDISKQRKNIQDSKNPVNSINDEKMLPANIFINGVENINSENIPLGILKKTKNTHNNNNISSNSLKQEKKVIFRL